MYMNIKNIPLYFVLFYLTTTAAAQTSRFANRNLRQLAAALEASYEVDCTRPGTTAFGRKRFVVEQDSLGRIVHIGLKIFPDEIVRKYPSPVYHFVERYLLELYLQSDPAETNRRLKEDQVVLRFSDDDTGKIRHDIDQHLPRFDTNTSLYVLTDNNRYTVTAYQGKKMTFSMNFPIRYELLWGMNKIEAENGLYEALAYYHAPQSQPPLPLPANESNYLQADGEGCFVLPGDTYLIETVNADRFYRQKGGGLYLPVWEQRWAVQSLHNLFQLPIDRGVTASVKQRLYNRRTLEFDIPLHKLLSFCRVSGCRAYMGIETCTTDSVTGTVVLLNPSYGYCHQLYFSVPAALIAEPERHKMKIELYAFVPTHNIGNLFYEKRQKQ